ncbi:MAG: outer membrane beta-barrel protein [Candidatus Acidiferrales bacterium]
MKKFAGLFVFSLLLGLPTMAQDTPVYEIEGGYTLRSYYPPSAARFVMNGWNVTGDYNIKRWLGVAADLSGTYKNQGVDGTTDIYAIVVGPRVHPFRHRHKLDLYGQLLFGAGYIRNTIPAAGGFPTLSKSDFSSAVVAGAGIDLRISEHWSVRLIEFDYENTRFFSSATTGTANQDNFRISIGISRRFGEK